MQTFHENVALTQVAQHADTQEDFSEDEPLVKVGRFNVLIALKMYYFLHFFLIFFVTDLDVRQSWAVFIVCK